MFQRIIKLYDQKETSKKGESFDDPEIDQVLIEAHYPQDDEIEDFISLI